MILIRKTVGIVKVCVLAAKSLARQFMSSANFFTEPETSSATATDISLADWSMTAIRA